MLSKGLIKCIAKGGYPKAAISAVLSPFQNGSEPVTTLKPTKHEFKTAFAEATIVFEGPFQVPNIKEEDELHFVCVGEQIRNGVLEYLVTDEQSSQETSDHVFWAQPPYHHKQKQRPQQQQKQPRRRRRRRKKEVKGEAKSSNRKSYTS
ncbi:hypothetical protein TCAL_16379 [Tigriopus californicus]|uniref:Uncharacterized protein n=1 Tax=Tigriopus californicus TaxID=6832 RepID=A0A553P016_TIGCA|nr:hypothetical protein TCAL_16379 [Tigriopus californicus]